MPRPRRSGVTALAVLATTAGLVLPAPAHAEPTGPVTLRSAELAVTVAPDFPRVIGYTDRASGAAVAGRDEPLDTVVIDGTPRTAVLDGEPEITDSRIGYRLSFPDLPDVLLDTSLSVEHRVTTFRVDAVHDTNAARVHTIEIPHHDLVSARGGDPGSQVAAARVDLTVDGSGDTVYPVTADTPADPAPIGSYFTLVSTGELAAALETNSVYDEPTGDAVSDNGHFWRQARKVGDQTVVGVWSGQWTYRAAGAAVSDTEPLPEVKIAITPERNGDSVVDWQDGAIALRDIAYVPRGAEQTADRVVQRIPFNIASMATHPFGKTLDETKRINLATAGLGQFVLLKGYQSEGHDAAHPDYGGHYNTRAGGLSGLNALLDNGSAYNAEFGVHVNATEAYPEAHAFSETLADKTDPQWAWMDQSYKIDQRLDLTSGAIGGRLDQLADETGGRLDFLYWDVFRDSGWLGDRLARESSARGFSIATEWSHRFVRDSLWSHWSADFDYGGTDLKGINSRIMRFVDNHRRDVYVPHPLLGSAQIVEYEGWTGETDYHAFLTNVFANNLPTKFLQHFPIQRWADQEITLADGVRVTGTSAADRRIIAGSATVADGDAYLLPWDPTDPDRLYHYNADGGTTTWRLPKPFDTATSLRLSTLTDSGRTGTTDVDVHNGQIALTAAPNTAYVLEPESPATPDPRYGEGGPVADPGFDYGDLRAWDVSGTAGVERNAKGQREAVVTGDGATELSQSLRGLAPGSYSASVDVEVAAGAVRPASITVTPAAGRPAATTVDRSTLPNYTASDEKHGTGAQRIRVFFDVTGDGATLALRAAAGAGQVRFDNVRVVPMTAPTAPGTVTSWDFEDVDAGWGPFYRGLDTGDATTHLAERHEPYTQRGWNDKAIDDVLAGDWSLKSFEHEPGVSYRSTPGTIRFEAGHRYQVRFAYESAVDGAYAWVLGRDGSGGTEIVEQTPLAASTAPGEHVQEFVAGTGQEWVGLARTGSAGEQFEFSLDDFQVRDLGVA